MKKIIIFIILLLPVISYAQCYKIEGNLIVDNVKLNTLKEIADLIPAFDAGKMITDLYQKSDIQVVKDIEGKETEQSSIGFSISFPTKAERDKVYDAIKNHELTGLAIGSQVTKTYCFHNETIPKSLDYRGVRFGEYRSNLEIYFRQAHDDLTDAYYNYWKKEDSKPVKIGGKTFDKLSTPAQSRTQFDKLHGYIMLLLEKAFHEENVKLPVNEQIPETQYRYHQTKEGDTVDLYQNTVNSITSLEALNPAMTLTIEVPEIETLKVTE